MDRIIKEFSPIGCFVPVKRYIVTYATDWMQTFQATFSELEEAKLYVSNLIYGKAKFLEDDRANARWYQIYDTTMLPQKVKGKRLLESLWDTSVYKSEEFWKELAE